MFAVLVFVSFTQGNEITEDGNKISFDHRSVKARTKTTLYTQLIENGTFILRRIKIGKQVA